MVTTDPISDMLTRIRNAVMVRHESVDMPYSTMKFSIAKLLKEEVPEDIHRVRRGLEEPYHGVEEGQQAGEARLHEGR